MGRPKGTYDRELAERVLGAYLLYGSGAAAARALGMAQPNVSRILRREGVCPGRGANREQYPLPLDEIVSMYAAGQTTTEIGMYFGVSDEVVLHRLKRAQVPRRNRGFRKGERNPSWKDGRSSNDPASRTQSRSDARVLASLCLGRPLAKGEIVHHMDEVPENNATENMYVFPTDSHHLRYHRQLERLPLADRAAASIQLALENGGRALPPLPSRIPFALYREMQSLCGKRWKTFVDRTLRRHNLLSILELEPRQ